MIVGVEPRVPKSNCELSKIQISDLVRASFGKPKFTGQQAGAGGDRFQQSNR
jgi:hypothetical protein